jgi:uncharacterized protein
MRARVPVTLIPLFLAVPPVSAQEGGQTRTVDAQFVTYGSGEVTLSPQRALLRVGMTTHAPAAAAASNANARRLNAVLDALRKAGFPRDSLQTLAFGVGPNYDYNKGNKLVDYEASASTRLRVRDLTRIGRIIDLVLAAGATDVGNIVFESDSLEIGRRQALTQALGKARGDAEALARAAGGALGRLIEVTARDDYGGGFAMAAYARRASALDVETSITPRDVVVRVSIEARWEYLPGH